MWKLKNMLYDEIIIKVWREEALRVLRRKPGWRFIAGVKYYYLFFRQEVVLKWISINLLYRSPSQSLGWLLAFGVESLNFTHLFVTFRTQTICWDMLHSGCSAGSSGRNLVDCCSLFLSSCATNAYCFLWHLSVATKNSYSISTKLRRRIQELFLQYGLKK